MVKIIQKTFKEAIPGSMGIQVNIAKALSVGRPAITKYIQRYPKMKELLEAERMKCVDKAENEIFNQIQFFDEESPVPAARIRQRAAEFILTRLGKDRGYVEKQEIEMSGNVETLSKEEREQEIKRLLKK